MNTKSPPRGSLKIIGRSLLAGFFAACFWTSASALECSLDVTKTCEIPPPVFLEGCGKPITELTFIWSPELPSDWPETIMIKAYNDKNRDELVAEVDGIKVGDEVTVAGFGGNNDIIWDIFSSVNLGGNLVGASTFHLSCSDGELDGTPDDCGGRLGNGKKDDPNFDNEWLFEGMVAANGVADCSPPIGGDSKQCVIAEGEDCAEVTYTYQVTNDGSANLLVFMDDDKLGPIPSAPGIIFLPAGETSQEFTKTVEICETTTNVFRARGFVRDAGTVPCEDIDTNTVTKIVPPPPPPCMVDGVGSITFDGKKVDWDITNTHLTNNAEIESIYITWPDSDAANKKLKKVKLAGSEIAKPDDNDPSTSITSFTGSALDRTIGPLQTKTLSFEFDKNADTDPGKYFIVVTFTGACEASFGTEIVPAVQAQLPAEPPPADLPPEPQTIPAEKKKKAKKR